MFGGPVELSGRSTSSSPATASQKGWGRGQKDYDTAHWRTAVVSICPGQLCLTQKITFKSPQLILFKVTTNFSTHSFHPSHYSPNLGGFLQGQMEDKRTWVCKGDFATRNPQKTWSPYSNWTEVSYLTIVFTQGREVGFNLVSFKPLTSLVLT